MIVLDDIAKAILGYLPRSGTVTIRALTHNLDLAEEEAWAGLLALMAHGLADQRGSTTYFLTDKGASFRAMPRVAALPG